MHVDTEKKAIWQWRLKLKLSTNQEIPGTIRSWKGQLRTSLLDLGCGGNAHLLTFDLILLIPRTVLLLLFSHPVLSHSLQPHGLQHARLPCPSPTPGACSNSCASSRWCHSNILSSVIPFSSCLQSFPASGSFPMSWLFTSVAKVSELQLQHQSFQWIFKTDLL